MSLQLVAWIVLPLVLFLIGAGAAGIRGLIKFTQYMVRAEATQAVMAKTNQEVADRLVNFIDKTEAVQGNHETRITVLEYEADVNKRIRHQRTVAE